MSENYVIGVRRTDMSVELVEVRGGIPVFCKTDNPIQFKRASKALDWARWLRRFLLDQMTSDYCEDSIAVMKCSEEGVYQTVMKI